MSDGHDLAIDAGDRETAAGPMPAPPPLVVIQYRNRGLPAVLVPPAMIVMAALAILSYQRLTPARRLDQATAPGDPARPRPGRTILVEPPSSGVAIGPIVARGKSSSSFPAATTSPATAVVEAAPMVAPGDEDLSPFDLDATAGLRPVEPPPAPLEAANGPPLTPPDPAAPGAPAGAETGPALEAHLGPVPNPVEAAGSPKPGRAERPAIGFKPPSSEPPDLLEPPEPEPPRAVPEPTKEGILAEFRREAAQKQVERQELEAVKPQARQLQIEDAKKKANAERVTFRQELHEILKVHGVHGGRAGPAIKDLCNQYGRDTPPENRDAVNQKSKWLATHLTSPDEVDMMRDRGLPEPTILDHIAWGLHPAINSRGGPRDENEVRVLAALRLLSMPIAPARGRSSTARVFQPGSQPVAAGPTPSVPSPGRRP